MAPSSPAPAEEDATALAAAASASGSRRRGRRSLSWRSVFCFAGRREGCLLQDQDQEALAAETPWQMSRRRKRTVPVDGDPVATTTADLEDDDEESPKGLRVHGCCFFLPPARTHRRQQVQRHAQNRASSLSLHHGTADNKQRRVERTEQPPPATRSRSGSETNSPSSEAPAPSRAHRAAQPPAETRAPTPTPRTKAHGGRARSSNDSEASAREPCTKGPAGVGAFGPVVGLSVVAAVSMAGLLGGRVWAVACVCAWLAALSWLRQRNAPAAGSDAGQEVAVDVDSTDYKKLVVLRGLLERDRTKAVTA